MNPGICKIWRTLQIVILFLFQFFGFDCKGQIQKSPLAELRNTTSSEKIYLHCNRLYYLPGDTVWFKAYVFDGLTPSKHSKNFYLQAYNSGGKVLANVTAPILTWGAVGHVILPVDFDGDVLFLRAYTSSMLNADAEFIPVKSIRVVHSKTSPTNQKSIPSIKFFPEGGELVCGLPCIVAFKIFGKTDSAKNRGGIIRNTHNKTVAEFSEGYDGMGIFSFIAKQHETYIAFWTDENGKERRDTLPFARPGGVVLHVNDIKNGKKFFVFRTQTTTDRELFLMAKIGSQTVYQSKINLSEKNGLNGVIPIHNLPSGILRITIYNKIMKPLAERICFINNLEYRFHADVTAIIINKKPRGLNRLTITVKDDLVANLSVSVTDTEANSSLPDTENLISSRFLSGELHGSVYNPSRYFTGMMDSLKLRDLDLVMLTHGWRRDVNTNTSQEKRLAKTDLEDHYITLDGKLNDLKYANSSLNIFVKTTNQNELISNTNTNDKGRFTLKDLVFYGKANLFIKAGKAKDFLTQNQLTISNSLYAKHSFADSTIIAQQQFLSSFDSISVTHLKMQAAKTDSNKMQKNILLKEVDIQAKATTQIQKLDKLHAAGVFAGTDFSRNIDLTNDKTAFVNASIFQYLQNKVPGMRIIEPLSIAPSAMWRDENVMFFLNNQRAYTVDIRELPVTEIEYIKVYEPSMGAAFGAVGGVVSIYTKKGFGAGTIKKTTEDFVSVEGYSVLKEFYSPDYSGIKKDNVTDKRVTLYWNPELLFDKNKKTAEIKFYNNDITKKFRLVLEGINSAGKMVHIEKIF